MDLDIIGEAAGLFAVTNIDDILVLALFFAQGAGRPRVHPPPRAGPVPGLRRHPRRGGATFLPESAIPYLGLLPLALGLKAAWQAWKDHRNEGEKGGVYVPVFATASTGGSRQPTKLRPGDLVGPSPRVRRAVRRAGLLAGVLVGQLACC
ncbi:hypothetical protein [Streptomyces sp. Tue6028]|uniref:hypothetical protein n=1 Tax=Streptomyces sp. Tue6028 TaxID=2036037 RepID=UPI003EBEC86D